MKLKPIKDFTIRNDTGGATVSVNKLETELIHEIRTWLGGATDLITVLGTLNKIAIDFNPNYDSDQILQALEEILTNYYAPVPEAFGDFTENELQICD